MRRACELVVPLGTFCAREWRQREIGMDELKKVWFRSSASGSFCRFMHGDLIPGHSFWARFVSTLFSTLKDVKKLVTITTTKESSSCFRKSMKNIFGNTMPGGHKIMITKIGDRFIVDISKNFTFSVGAFQNHLIASSRSSTVERYTKSF